MDVETFLASILEQSFQPVPKVTGKKLQELQAVMNRISNTFIQIGSSLAQQGRYKEARHIWEVRTRAFSTSKACARAHIEPLGRKSHLSDLFTFCKHKSIDYLAGLMPKTYSMVEENNILGIYPQFIITKQENLVGALELQGLSYLNLMQQDLEHYFNARQSALDGIPSGVCLRIVAKRRKERVKQNPHLDNSYAQACSLLRAKRFLITATI